MIPTLAEAIARIVAGRPPLAPEPCMLEAALGRVLARDVVAPRTLPPWDNAGMDGYAVRASDIAMADAAPVTLRVVGSVPAGMLATTSVEPGTAVRIFTGAPVPPGADSVVRWEDTDRGDPAVVVHRSRDAGRHVRPAGADVREGDIALSAGTVLTPAALQYLAALGLGSVIVHRAPRVAIVRTGDELVPLDQAATVEGAHIVDSNGVGLAAAVRAAGGIPLDGGIVRDDLAAFAAALGEMALQADLVLSAGGVSGGDYDFAKGAVARAGGVVHFWKVRCRPGSQLAFGTLLDKPWIGLPGNPVSSLVGFEVFVRPLLRILIGDPAPYRRIGRAVLDETLKGDADVTMLLRGHVEWHEQGLPHARRAGAQGSHIHSSLARANALLLVPAGTTSLAAGDPVATWPLDEGPGTSTFPIGVT